MRKEWIYTIQMALSLVIVIGLATGCAVPFATSPASSTSTPPPSKYPADISGHVTIAEKVKSGTAIAVPPNKEGDIFWIVDVSVKNNAYDAPVEASLETGYKGWEIVANDKMYRPRASGSPKEHPPISVALGKTGQFMLHFSIPKTLQISDAQICYRGQEPYSYGKLTGGDKVAAYDWDSKTVIKEQPTKEESQNYEQTTFIINKNGWEITLNKHTVKANTITVTITFTSHFNSPKDYSPFNAGEGEIVCVDQYSIAFPSVENKTWYEGRYYPGDTKTDNLKFIVNPKSGKISLWLYQVSARFGTSSIYPNYNRIKLFDLGEVK